MQIDDVCSGSRSIFRALSDWMDLGRSVRFFHFSDLDLKGGVFEKIGDAGRI